MTTITTTKPPKATTRLHVCFSFAAYAKTLIDHLRSLNIPILPGLTDHEFTSIETTFGFTFPPDLRAILQEGLPVGAHFPNWRSSSPPQIQVLLNLPSLNLSKNVSHNNFWVDSWGPKPHDAKKAAKTLKSFLEKAPVLVPIHGNCYIPCTPTSAGNPVFYVDDNTVRINSYDISRFFQEFESSESNLDSPSKLSRKEKASINVPAWAATSPRRVSFWTDAAENGRRVVVREATSAWWTGGDLLCHGKELRHCLEEGFWKLRDGGWREEEVREMMMMDGCDRERMMICDRGSQINKQNVVLHVRAMSRVLLRAGWCREDVVHSLDLADDLEDDHNGGNGNKSFLDFQPPSSCSIEDDDHHHKKMSIKGMMDLQVS